jgi:hypothetical protein
LKAYEVLIIITHLRKQKASCLDTISESNYNGTVTTKSRRSYHPKHLAGKIRRYAQLADKARKGRVQKRVWDRISRIYTELTRLTLPEAMRPVERRIVDTVLLQEGYLPRILEFDEEQHFNEFRAATLKCYGDAPVAFDTKAWLAASLAKKKLEGGGFAKAKPPLFPDLNGRHRQRAFRDALCDLIPPLHGFAPTLRIAKFEVRSWIYSKDAERRMDELLSTRSAKLNPC